VSTIRDVATEAGVSISTVSLVLNTPSRVAPDTLQRVISAVDTLGYVPKAEAAARARRSVRRIGAVGPFTTHSAAMLRLAGLLVAAPDSGAEIVVYDEISAAKSPSPRLSALPRNGSLDALVIVSHPLDESIATAISDHSLPTVLVDTWHPGFSSIRTDDREGGRLAGEHLLAGGLTAPGFIGEAQVSSSYLSPAGARLNGFRDALGAAGLALQDANCVSVREDFATAREAARHLLTSPQRPDGISASSDLLAAACLAEARSLRIRIPEDLSVIGYDDGEVAQALELSTVHQPFEQCGRLAVEILTDSRPGQQVQDTMLRLEVVPRATTRV
jgi:LacI family transcriptional regulator